MDKNRTKLADILERERLTGLVRDTWTQTHGDIGELRKLLSTPDFENICAKFFLFYRKDASLHFVSLGEIKPDPLNDWILSLKSLAPYYKNGKDYDWYDQAAIYWIRDYRTARAEFHSKGTKALCEWLRGRPDVACLNVTVAIAANAKKDVLYIQPDLSKNPDMLKNELPPMADIRLKWTASDKAALRRDVEWAIGKGLLRSKSFTDVVHNAIVEMMRLVLEYRVPTDYIREVAERELDREKDGIISFSEDEVRRLISIEDEAERREEFGRYIGVKKEFGKAERQRVRDSYLSK